MFYFPIRRQSLFLTFWFRVCRRNWTQAYAVLNFYVNRWTMFCICCIIWSSLVLLMVLKMLWDMKNLVLLNKFPKVVVVLLFFTACLKTLCSLHIWVFGCNYRLWSTVVSFLFQRGGIPNFVFPHNLLIQLLFADGYYYLLTVVS